MATYDEATEVKSEDALNDMELFCSVTQEIRKIMEQVATLKAKCPDKWRDMVQELRIEGSFHFLTLKKLNRIAQIRCKIAKDVTTEAKHKLDGNNLRLQNLQYEISHLDKEINNCLQFKSKHEDITLVDVDEFYIQAPEKLTRPQVTRNDDHLQMLARLDWELESRKNLDAKLKATHDQKDEMSERIKKRKQDLDSLRPSLETILKSTMPLQEALGDHFTETRALHDNAYLLPQPLYVLFVQSRAFAAGCDHNIETQIGGDLNAAAKLKSLANRKVLDATNLYHSQEDDESDSENEEEQENQRGRRRSTSVSAAVKNEPKFTTDGHASRHPLYVSFKVFLEAKMENSPYLLLRFYHYSDPECVSVLPSLELSSSYGNIKKSAVLSPTSLLHNLQEKDNGREISGMNRVFGENTKLNLPESQQCYLWAQKLAGLDALECGAQKSQKERYSNVRLIIRLLRQRVISRLTLAEQLHKFKNGVIDCDHSVVDAHAPSISFKLSSWETVDFAKYCSLSYTNGCQNLSLACEDDFFFFASLHRGSSAVAHVAICLPNQYPKKWPLLSINLQWRGNHTSENNLNLREIEVEVNCRVPESIYATKKLRSQILSFQMHRLLSMLDVYVETDSNMGGSDMPSEFPTTRLCPRVAKGRSRLKPYKYNQRYKFQCY